MTSPPWMPMPISSGSGNSLASARFISPTCQSIKRAASKACAQASSAPVSAPKIAITPSPINWLGVPPAAAMALPTASKNRFRMKTTSNGNRFSTSSVDRRISTNRIATNRSVPLSLRFKTLWSAIVVCGGKKRPDADIGDRLQLARQANRAIRAKPGEHPRLDRRLRRQALETKQHAHPAGGAACPAATERGMRNPGAAARIEHAEPLGNAHRSAIGIDDANPSAPALEEGAHAARNQNEDERAGETDPKPVHNRGQRAGDDRIATAPGLTQCRQPSRIELDLLGDLPGSLIYPEQSHCRQKHGHREQQRRYFAVMGFDPQPQVQADAAVQPSDAEDNDLADAGHRIGNKKTIEGVAVDPMDSEQR